MNVLKSTYVAITEGTKRVIITYYSITVNPNVFAMMHMNVNTCDKRWQLLSQVFFRRKWDVDSSRASGVWCQYVTNET